MKENQIVLPPDAKENGVRIIPPQGCEVEKIETVDGVVAVTFKKKEQQLPKSWEEFCKMFPITEKEFYITDAEPPTRKRLIDDDTKRDKKFDLNCLPDRATAEAVLAMFQLIQLRDCYNGDWVPDWTNYVQNKYVIIFENGSIKRTTYVDCSRILYFKSEELRNEFLHNFRPLIEKLKPLYGIKEGGEE